MSKYPAELAKAQNTNTSSEMLFALSALKDEDIQQALAANPNSPFSLLVSLGTQYPSDVLNNPNFPALLAAYPDVLLNLSPIALQAALRQPEVPLYLLEHAANIADTDLQLALVSDSQTPESVLRRLLTSRIKEVKHAAGMHVSLAGEASKVDWAKLNDALIPLDLANVSHQPALQVVSQLCGFPEPLVEVWIKEGINQALCLLAANSAATSPRLLSTLVEASTDQATAREALKNKRTPLEVIEQQANQAETTPLINPLTKLAKKLLSQRRESTSESVKQRPLRPNYQKIKRSPRQTIHLGHSLFHKARISKDEELIKEAAETKTKPQRLAELSRNSSIKVRRAVAKNTSTSLKTLLTVCARQPSLYGELLSLLSEESSRSRHHSSEANQILDLLSDICLDPLEIKLARLCLEGTAGIHLFLASRYDTPSIILHELAQENVSLLQQRVADHPYVQSETLRLLANASDSQVREAVAYNERTPVDVLTQLAKDSEDWIRANVAKNPSTPASTISELLSDKCTEVKQSAIAHPALSESDVLSMLCDHRSAYLLQHRPYIRDEYPTVIPDVISHFCQQRNLIVRYLALCCESAPEEALESAATSLHWIERLAAAQNARTSHQRLEKLKGDSHQLVRAAANDSHA